MRAANTKIGDIFYVEMDENNKKYFQLIAFDLYQLNSDVIRTFEKSYPIDSNPNLSEIVAGNVEFYAHCVTKFGLKMGLWKKYGNIADVGKTDHIIFRGTSDYGVKTGEQPIKISQNWYVWRLGDLQTVWVGKLNGENRDSEIGLIMNPYDIIGRIKFGKYPGVYPHFE